MKITRQLRRADANREGFAPIQLTVAWNGFRVREPTGERTRAEFWDTRTQLVLALPGSHAGHVNGRLDRLRHALEKAYQDARDEGRRLAVAEVQALIRQVRDPAPAAEPLPVAAPAPAAGFLDLMREWIADYALRFNPRTHLPITETYLKALRATRSRLAKFELVWKRPLTLANMDAGFYHDFYKYEREELGQELNTFGKHISRLCSFLGWCEEERGLAVNLKYRKFVAPSVYVGVKALTEYEVRQLQALDFRAPAVLAQIQVLRSTVKERGLLPQNATYQQWAAHLELARDKFLLCCYTGLRISDAQRLAWSHVEGNVIVIRAGKNQHDCYIPFYDDGLFNIAALAERYRGVAPKGLVLPVCHNANKALKLVQQLAGIGRLPLSTKLGRKTFVTTKLYQGVARATVMQATGHTTEKSFNHYVGVDTLELFKAFSNKSPAMSRQAA